jgi:thiol-disulfide isomerase/thioredoxin
MSSRNRYHMYKKDETYVPDCDENTMTIMKEIPHLDESDFEIVNNKLKLNYKHAENTKKSVVMVYANWCGPCSANKPEYSKMAEQKNQNGIALLAVDGSSEYLPKAKNVKGRISLERVFEDFESYPSYYLFDKDGFFERKIEGGIRGVANLK